MKQSVPISEIMSKELVTMSPFQSLYEVEELFNHHNIRHIPIVDEGKLIGVISRSDLLKISFSDLNEESDTVESVIYDAYSIPQVMTKNPITVESETTIMEVTEILSRQSFHSLPVVKEGVLVGIVTSTDLIQYLLDQYYRWHY